MTRTEIRSRIEEIGIIPSVRVSSHEDAMFAADAVSRGGIPIVEITLTVPGAFEVISDIVHNAPHLIVGAGGVMDVDTARACLQAGAKFITSDGLDPETVKYVQREGCVMIPGTLTPTDIISAWKLVPDFVKVVPCGHVGGDRYIRDLKTMFPKVSMIAAGGVDQLTVSNFILAGAIGVGIGAELIPGEAVRNRQPERIAELARRFLSFVAKARTS